jgi:hypothetical protein
MSQAMFTKPIRGFLLGKVLARTCTVYLVISGLAINLAGNPSMPVNDFHMPIQGQSNGFVDPGNVGRKDGFGFVSDLKNGSTEGYPSGDCTVLCEGVAFPIVGCYHCHCSIPLREGLRMRRYVSFPGLRSAFLI